MSNICFRYDITNICYGYNCQEKTLYYCEGQIGTKKKTDSNIDPEYKALDTNIAYAVVYDSGNDKYKSVDKSRKYDFQSCSRSLVANNDYTGNIECLYPSIGDCYLIFGCLGLKFENRDNYCGKMVARVSGTGISWIGQTDVLKILANGKFRISNKIKFEDNGKFRLGYGDKWTEPFTTNTFSYIKTFIGLKQSLYVNERLVACCFVVGSFNNQPPVKTRCYLKGRYDEVREFREKMQKFYEQLAK